MTTKEMFNLLQDDDAKEEEWDAKEEEWYSLNYYVICQLIIDIFLFCIVCAFLYIGYTTKGFLDVDALIKGVVAITVLSVINHLAFVEFLYKDKTFSESKELAIMLFMCFIIILFISSHSELEFLSYKLITITE